MKLEEKYIGKYSKMKIDMKKIIFIGFIILFSISCNTEKQDLKSYDNIQLIDLIERVEPPNWWVGMKTKNLQILVYGNSINDLIPKISNSNIELISFDKVKNENYLFLNISISENAKPDEVEIDFYKNNVVVDRYIFSLLNREKNASNVEGFNSSDVMYLITPDRFANGDSTNDDIKSMFERPNRDYNRGLHGGDIKGIINHLDYIKDLGFTTVWLNPVLENNMKKSSYHGYSTTDYYKVDPRFGSNELFQELSISAKEKGIKLVMDLIPNHCGSEHWFFKDPPMG